MSELFEGGDSDFERHTPTVATVKNDLTGYRRPVRMTVEVLYEIPEIIMCRQKVVVEECNYIVFSKRILHCPVSLRTEASASKDVTDLVVFRLVRFNIV